MNSLNHLPDPAHDLIGRCHGNHVWQHDPDLRARFSNHAPAMFRQLLEFNRPIIAAVNGVAAAGGFEPLDGPKETSPSRE